MAVLGKAISLSKANYIDIEDDKEYRIAGVQNYGKGVVIRRIVMGSELTMKKYQVIKKNQLMWCKVDTKNGAFGITHEHHVGALASTNMALATINEELYIPEFVEALFQLKPFYDWITKYSSGSTNRKYLIPKELLAKVEIPDLIINKQISFQKKVNFLKKSGFDTVLTHQQTLLKKLRQQILQEAIEGKLTAEWRAQNPNVEPATKLLKRITTEKAQLIKDKKIKAQKPLPPITDEEKPFELPQGWEWCRLGDISENKVGATPDRNNPEYWCGTINWVSSGEVANNYISNTREKITDMALGGSSARVNPKGSVLVAMIGQGKTRGQTAILNIDAATNQNVCAIRPRAGIIPEILWYFFLSRYEKTRSGASGGNQPALNGIKISNTVFGLPSIAEAREIIKKLRTIESALNQLETQITQNQTHAEHLMQAVLKEAFSHNSETGVTAVELKAAAHA